MSHTPLNPNRFAPLCILLAMLVPAALTHAQPANDLCDNPETLTGVGTFPWSNVGADSVLLIGTECYEGDLIQIEHDIWFCWTAVCDGTVRISTCGLAEFDTRLQLFAFCECPTDKNLLCCADNECGEQAEINCDVVCDRQYMIRLGSAQPDMVGQGFLEIECMTASCAPNGGDDPVPPVGCDVCCEVNPLYRDRDYSSFGGGQVAFFTREGVDAGESVLIAYDITDEANAPLNTDWAPPRYSSPNWVKAKIGTVFGVAANGQGEVFVAHSSAYSWSPNYNSDTIGSQGAAGTIYRIDPVTAAATPWITLPNTQDPSIALPGEAWPGIGNIAWDCNFDQMFASNMDDGRIYRIDASGSAVETYDHATGIVSAGGAAELGDDAGFAPLGERVWAVCPSLERLYYSVWKENTGQESASESNEIWSVALDATGAFVPGTAALEITMPPMSATYDYSNPVSDMAFSDDCCLIIAERSMQGPTTVWSHRSRVMKFCFDDAAGGWGPSADTYEIGSFFVGDNASGGVDFDGGAVPFIWASGDALHYPPDYPDLIYGLIGLPASGGVHEDGIMIDSDEDVALSEKHQMGSVEVTCWEGHTGGCVAEGELECMIDAAGGLSDDYALTLTITNNSGQDAHHLNIAGPVSDTSIPLAPLQDGDFITLNLTLYGPYTAGDVVCLSMTLLNADSEECCAMEVCMDVPECDCAILEIVDIQCIKDGLYTFTLSVTNLYDPHIIEHLFFNADAGSPNVFSPEWVQIGPLAPFNKAITAPIQLQTTAVAGDTISVNVALHNEQMKECCVEELSFVLPECDGPSGCTADLNGDGVVDGADLGLLLANFGGAGLGDIDCDGDVDGADLGLLLAAWGPVGP